MGVSTETAGGTEPFVKRPDHHVGYVAILLALVTGAIHLFEVTEVIGFDGTLALLFALNGLGFLGGVAVYLTRYWRRELFLVAALYSLATIVAFFDWNGWGLAAFYIEGELSALAIASKATEAMLVFVAVYLYSEAGTRSPAR